MRKILLTLAMLLTAVLPALASADTPAPALASADTPVPTLDLTAFGKIPVMHDGRIKPMDAFADYWRAYFAGTRDGALPWLVDTLFNPARASARPAIKVANPDLLALLGLERRASHLYTYAELAAAMDAHRAVYQAAQNIVPERRTPAQTELLALGGKVADLADLLASLTLFMPISVAMPDSVTLKGPVTYLDALPFREPVEKQVKVTLRKKGEDVKRYTDAEQKNAWFIFTLDRIRRDAGGSTALRVIPVANDAWRTPWALLIDGKGGPQTVTLFADWRALVRAYGTGGTKAWDSTIKDIRTQMRHLDPARIDRATLALENAYVTFNPFFMVAALYALTLALIGFAALWERPWIARAAPLAFLAALGLHGLGLLMRMLILGRPPVSTLYESVLFVGFVTGAYTLFQFWRTRRMGWLALGAGLGLFLQLVGFAHDQDGDNMVSLTAVLNTHFWLATHVLCITGGYAFCLLTAMQAHVSLAAEALPRLIKLREGAFRTLHTTALVALAFSAVGTVLGGIWADQSWGRFWGWDPKENGALLIVLWLTWVLHGRIGATMGTRAFTAGLAALGIVVALSWFGVNLLNVGLHSYGFTDSAARTLVEFIAGDTALIAALWWRAAKKEKEKESESASCVSN